MNSISQTPSRSARPQTLWAVIGVLGVAVVALGSALYYVQTREEALHSAAVSPVPVPVAVPAPAETQPTVADKPASADKKAAGKAAPAKVAAGTPRSAPVPSVPPTAAAVPAASPAADKPVAPPAKEVCLNCATVTAVTPIECEGQGSGAGAVAGGVLGALVGNQVGQGQGKDVATILGAIGGGFAGNTVEKKMKKSTVYRVDLRMDNGDVRSLEQATPASVGARVRVEGSTLLPLGN